MRDKIAGDETSMLKTGSAAEPVKIAEDNGITIYHINTDKFKTNTVHVFFDSNISEGNATMNALLPAVMRKAAEHCLLSGYSAPARGVIWGIL